MINYLFFLNALITSSPLITSVNPVNTGEFNNFYNLTSERCDLMYYLKSKTEDITTIKIGMIIIGEEEYTLIIKLPKIENKDAIVA